MYVQTTYYRSIDFLRAFLGERGGGRNYYMIKFNSIFHSISLWNLSSRSQCQQKAPGDSIPYKCMNYSSKNLIRYYPLTLAFAHFLFNWLLSSLCLSYPAEHCSIILVWITSYFVQWPQHHRQLWKLFASKKAKLTISKSRKSACYWKILF